MRFTEKNCCFGYIIPQTNIVGDNQISTIMLGKNCTKNMVSPLERIGGVTGVIKWMPKSNLWNL